MALPLTRYSSSLWEPTNTTSAPAAIIALQEDASKLPPNDIATIIEPTLSKRVRSIAFIMAILSDMLTGACVSVMASSISIPHPTMTSWNTGSMLALAYWKWPLSVSIPPRSIRPVHLSMTFPAESSSSLIISQQEVLLSSQ